MKQHRAEHDSSTAWRAAMGTGMPVNDEILTAVGKAGDAYVQALSEWREEVMSLANRQVEEGNAALAKLSKCGTPLDVALVHQQWAISATTNCLDEMGKLFAIAVKCAKNGMPTTNGSIKNEETPTGH